MDNSKEYKEGFVTIPGADSNNDKDLIQEIERRESKYKAEYNKILAKAQKGRKYWAGDQIDEKDLYEGEKATPVNKIIQSVETIIPRATKKIPQPNITILPRNKVSRLFQEKLQVELQDQWTVTQKLKIKLQYFLRNLFAQGFAGIKYYWDEEKDDYCFEAIPMGKIIFPFDCVDRESLPFVMEYVPLKYSDLERMFPDKCEEIKKLIGKDCNADTEITIIEYWKPKTVTWKYKEIILGTKDNPNWNYQAEIQEGEEESTKPWNHYKKPKIPYILANLYSFGDKIVDDISYIETLLALQDAINRRKRQMDQNAELTNGLWIAQVGMIEQDQFDKLDNSAGTKVMVKDINGLKKEFGQGFSPTIIADSNDSKSEFDNIANTPAAVRGQRDGADTARRNQSLVQSSLERMDLIFQTVEVLAADIYDAMLQMMCVYYDGDHPIIATNQNSTSQLNELDKQDFINKKEFEAAKSIRVTVDEGSTRPRDPIVERSEAMQLNANNKMSDLDMYKICEWPDPEGLAYRNYLQSTDPAKLYGEFAEGGYDPEAIRQLMSILEGEMDPYDEANGYLTDDLKQMERHMKTQNDYTEGVPIYEGLPPFENLTLEAQAGIREHIRLEAIHLDQMIFAEEQRLMMMKGMSQGIVPPIDGGVDPNATPGMPSGTMPLNQLPNPAQEAAGIA